MVNLQNDSLVLYISNTYTGFIVSDDMVSNTLIYASISSL